MLGHRPRASRRRRLRRRTAGSRPGQPLETLFRATAASSQERTAPASQGLLPRHPVVIRHRRFIVPSTMRGFWALRATHISQGGTRLACAPGRTISWAQTGTQCRVVDLDNDIRASRRLNERSASVKNRLVHLLASLSAASLIVGAGATVVAQEPQDSQGSAISVSRVPSTPCRMHPTETGCSSSIDSRTGDSYEPAPCRPAAAEPAVDWETKGDWY